MIDPTQNHLAPGGLWPTGLEDVGAIVGGEGVNSMPTWTQFATGHLAKDFTGVVYCDTGKLNYGAVLDGKILTMKNGRNRWFASAAGARLAIKAIQKGS